jgi:hypothetical protein
VALRMAIERGRLLSASSSSALFAFAGGGAMASRVLCFQALLSWWRCGLWPMCGWV